MEPLLPPGSSPPLSWRGQLPAWALRQGILGSRRPLTHPGCESVCPPPAQAQKPRAAGYQSRKDSPSPLPRQTRDKLRPMEGKWPLQGEALAGIRDGGDWRRSRGALESSSPSSHLTVLQPLLKTTPWTPSASEDSPGLCAQPPGSGHASL